MADSEASLPNDTNAHDDAILLELRAIKEALAAQECYDIDRILESARKRQEASGRIIIHPPQ